ncbi:MAG: LTA synthase family protein, partial [Oscillospiraceae bacterium]
MKTFWYFQKTTEGFSPLKKGVYWTMQLLLLTAAGLGLGLLSLLYAYGGYDPALLGSYFANPTIAVLNVVPVLVLVLLLYFAIGRAWAAFLVGGTLVLGLSVADYFMLLFRDDPLLFDDLRYIREAGTITQTASYNLTPDDRIWFGILCVAGVTVLLFFLARWTPRAKLRLPLCLALFFLTLPLSRVYADTEIYNVSARNNGLINRYSATEVYLSRGFVYPFLHSMTTGTAKPPPGYHEGETAALLASYPQTDIPKERQVDLITLQLEAFCDLSRLAIDGVDSSPFELYHALEEESVTGDLITNIFAGGTVDTERCFLTGFTQLQNFRTNTNSYGWYLGSQGYTVEGSHPCYEWFYNRRHINGYLGLPTYYFEENYYHDLSPDAIANDQILFPEILSLYEQHREADKPYFSFNVTYQGHGPYDTEEVWRRSDYVDQQYSQETRNIVNNYLGSIEDTAEQLSAFLDELRHDARPVVVVAYGDHKPWLGDGNSAWNELGVNLDTATEDGFRNYYSTRYLIWANDAAKAALGNDFVGEGEELSSNFLMNEVFELCGWTGNAYLQATNDIRPSLPVITSVGKYKENGKLTGELSPDGQAALLTFQS